MPPTVAAQRGTIADACGNAVMAATARRGSHRYAQRIALFEEGLAFHIVIEALNVAARVPKGIEDESQVVSGVRIWGLNTHLR